MWLLMVLEFVFVVLFVVFVVSQVVIPLWRGRRLFPFFRSRQSDLVDQYVEAGEDIDEAQLEHDVNNRKRSAEKVRGRSTNKGTHGFGN